jgi:hypothetical protein
VTALALAEAAGLCAGRAPIKRHWAVGIANSAPFGVLSVDHEFRTFFDTDCNVALDSLERLGG